MVDHEPKKTEPNVRFFLDKDIGPDNQISLDVSSVPGYQVDTALGISPPWEGSVESGNAQIFSTNREDTFLVQNFAPDTTQIQSTEIIRLGSKRLPLYKKTHNIS